MSEAPANPHLINGEFQSDKYPTTPRGKVPLSCKDATAQDLLWEYAQRRRPVDAEFSDALEAALKIAGFDPAAHPSPTYAEGRRAGLLEAARIVQGEVYRERYRTWPQLGDGNRSNDSGVVTKCDALATAIRTLAEGDGK
jgi:hypothetical protein